jgi:lipoyl(octanoyl) transferase
MTDMWRFIDAGPGTASFNMAADEAISLSVRKEVSPPTLRLYSWEAPSVSIGFFQKIASCNIGYCMRHHIPVVRRMTGGRALFHSDDITYSFSVRTKDDFSQGLLDSYRKISDAFIRAFLKTGLAPEFTLIRTTRHDPTFRSTAKSPLCFQSISYGELTIQNRKVIGSAQKRWPGGLLQQGTIPLSVDRNAMIEIFGMKNTEKKEVTIIGLQELAPLFDTVKFKDALRVSFEETFHMEFNHSSLSCEELSLARELEIKKYLADQWNFRR